MKSTEYWIAKLKLQKHPEGGYYRETYRAAESIPAVCLPPRFSGARAFSTAIYFLLPGSEISAFHRLKADEMWHFYAGKSLSIFEITVSGTLFQHHLGPKPEKSDELQAVVRAGSWLAAEVNGRSGFALAGCTVAPGFDFSDFEPGSRGTLLDLYPQYESLITKMTRSEFCGAANSITRNSSRARTSYPMQKKGKARQNNRNRRTPWTGSSD